MAVGDDIDLVAEILIRSDVADIIKCKGICKSWYSLIAAPYFVESYLKRTYKDDDDDIPQHTYKRVSGILMDAAFLLQNSFFVVGSSNGLVCVSPEDFELLIVNPCTGQMIKILEPPPEPLPATGNRWNLVWGFGYDSSNNDYKIIVGLSQKSSRTTRFYVLSLKTCHWIFIQECEYQPNLGSVSGVLCDGALHWRMMNWKTREEVIISFDLSLDEFTKIQLPNLDKTRYNLGFIEECLCLCQSPLPTKIWVFRSGINGNKSWVLLPNDYVMNCDALYFIYDKHDYNIYAEPKFLTTPVFGLGNYISAPIYVRSLVSPQVNMDSCSIKLIKGPSVSAKF